MKLMNKLISALKFNETQITSVILLTLMNAAAVSNIPSAPLWLWVIALLLYPSIAYLGNVFLGGPK
jgi:hypothetical protein